MIFLFIVTVSLQVSIYFPDDDTLRSCINYEEDVSSFTILLSLL